MCVLSIKVPLRKKSENLSYAPRIYIYIYIYIYISSETHTRNAHTHIEAQSYIYTHIDIFIVLVFFSVFVCVNICMKLEIYIYIYIYNGKNIPEFKTRKQNLLYWIRNTQSILLLLILISEIFKIFSFKLLLCGN